MVYGSSNYMNSVNSYYKYNYNTMKSSYSTANTAGVRNNSPTNNNSYVNSDAIKALTSIRNNASSLNDSLGVMTQSTTFSKMYAESSKAENVAVDKNSSVNSAYRDTQVEVKQTATANVNEGSQLNADDAYAGSAGTQRFEIEQDGKKHWFSVDVKAGDTNKAVQQKMANAINSRNLGFTAAVSENKNTGTSALSVQSKNTGTDARNEFSVRDLSGGNSSSSIVSDMGVGSRTQAARNAVYNVNGGANRTSQTNNVNLGGGVSVTLKNASSEAVTISARKDTQSTADAARSLVDSFNGLMGAAKSNSRLTGDLNSTYATYASSLKALGITAKSDGTLAIDNDKLDKAASNGSLESFFTRLKGNSFGFTGRLSQIASTAERGGYSVASSSNTGSSSTFMQNLTNSTGYGRNSKDSFYNYMFGTSGGSALGALINLYA